MAADVLGANRLPVDGGCVAPRAGLAPNSPAEAVGAAVLSLLENNEGPLVAGVNWNGLLEAAGSVDDAAGAPPKRLPVWNGF